MPEENRFLTSLPESALSELAPLLIEVSLSKDEILTQQGEPVKWVYFPISAVMSSHQLLEDGRLLESSLVGREDVIGMASVFGSLFSINSCVVFIGGTARKIRASDLVEAAERRPVLYEAIARQLARQTMRISKKLICSHYHTVEQRLCSWFLQVRDYCDGLDLPVTHEQMALALGVHRPTITAETMSLRDRGLIDYSRGRITLSDPKAIGQLACDCHDEASGWSNVKPCDDGDRAAANYRDGTVANLLNSDR